ncbi:Methyltransferase domain-containing protein [Azospirillum oryzae]|uniref:Methyltransferase domain-containing protein n=1 Tax=Azospirillum oryzae TaxID=286727 RepID=A0A1X7EYH3_9PROT|nr:class I SAM-dependent methyltransferase [Azospirillum oryzae]SMF42512.1 Methyltransferase domain-containing protein [Azospirillum oryzae]
MQIRNRIFEQSPYEGFDVNAYTFSDRTESHPIFRHVISQIKPSLLIEVGTWKGASAVHMAGLCKEYGVDNAEIVCVDTWLGSSEMWADKTPNGYWGFHSLGLKNGYPTIYYQFLANVVLKGVSDIITPFPISSSGAAVFLKALGIKADVIYIDGGHSYQEAKADIEAYWPLLRVGGVMIGDDYHEDAPGVIRAVTEFGELIDRNPVIHHRKWLMVKP